MDTQGVMTQPKNHSSTFAHQPLAERLRPRTLGEVVGQQQVLGEGMPLRLAFESGRPHSYADYLGVSYRHLLYVMAQFVEKGFLKKENRIYRIADKKALLQLAHVVDPDLFF